jgi:hypothetical protein
MKCKAGRTAVIRLWLSMNGAVVNALTANGSSRFAQVYPDLVSAARAQAAFNQGKGPQLFKHTNLGYGALALMGRPRTATPPITSIAYQERVKGPRDRSAPNDRKIGALNLMAAEFLSKGSLGLACPGK